MTRAAAAIGLAACLFAIAHEALSDDLPTDPFRRCAVKALRGDYGPLKSWQRDAYRRGLKLGVTTERRFVVTAYWRGELGGSRDHFGNLCTLRTCASNRINAQSFIWTEKYGLRQVLDCGAKSNENETVWSKRLQRHIRSPFALAHDSAGWEFGTASWCDYWYPSARAAQRAGCGGWTPTRGAVVP